MTMVPLNFSFKGEFKDTNADDACTPYLGGHFCASGIGCQSPPDLCGAITFFCRGFAGGGTHVQRKWSGYQAAASRCRCSGIMLLDLRTPEQEIVTPFAQVLASLREVRYIADTSY